MSSTITCTYTFVPTAVPIGTLQTLVQAVPIDFTLLNLWGLFLSSDSTTNSGAAVTRSMVLAMNPGSAATATATLFAGDPGGSPIKSVSTTPGTFYARPPVAILSGGGPPGFGAPVFNDTNNAPQARQGSVSMQMAVSGFQLISEGSSYTSPTVVFSGGSLAPGGIPVQATATVGLGGAITAVTVSNPVNGPYDSAPLVSIVDGAGSGAEIVAGLSVSGATIVDPGFGYTSPPTITLTPLFKQMAPDSSGLPAQAATVQNWMTKIFESALNTVATSVAIAA